LFRSIPLLVLLLWVFYGLPVVLGLQLGVFATGVLSLALSDSAFEAEVFRAGIQSVPKGQLEAAKSIGLSWSQQMRLVVMPQAIKVILPALGNQFVYVMKMSSLVSVIGLEELTRRSNELNVSEYRPLEIYTFLVLEYLALIVFVSWLVRRLERRMATAH
jgi:polar amino acid transport system permease protein